jgi:hypothetical protein
VFCEYAHVCSLTCVIERCSSGGDARYGVARGESFGVPSCRVNGSKRSLSPRRKPARVRMFDGGAGGGAARLSMYHYCTQTTHGEMALLMTICVLMLGSAAGFCPSALPNCAPVGMARAAPVIMKDWSKRAVSLFIFYSSTDCIYPCFGAHNLSFPTSQRPQCATCVARYLLTLCALTCVPKP